jgi:hypothetical protein
MRSSITSMASRAERNPSTSRRKGRCAVSATKAPTPWRVTTRPSDRNAATASRTTVRLTPVAAIISCSVGSLVPGASRPCVMSAVTRSINSCASRRGAVSGLNPDKPSVEV